MISARSRSISSGTAASTTPRATSPTTRCERMLDLFAGVDSAALKDQRAAELAALPLGERLERRTIDGAREGPRSRPRPGPRRGG